MPPLLTVSSVMMCPHGGCVQAIPSNTQTLAGGDPVLRASDTFLVAGCVFTIGVVPNPCVMVQWVQTALNSQVLSDFTLTQESVGLCIADTGAPQGVVLIIEAQPQVLGM